MKIVKLSSLLLLLDYLLARKESHRNMGRKKCDRSDKTMQTFEITLPLRARLRDLAKRRSITVSALIREILERYFEDRHEF